MHLCEIDSEAQTLECRANNPDTFENGILHICVFVNSDNICKKPSRA